MAFNYNITIDEPATVTRTQDTYVYQALNDALSAWSRFLNGNGSLNVHVSISGLGGSASGGAFIAAAGPTTSTPVPANASTTVPTVVEMSSAYALRTGQHLATSDIEITFNSAFLPVTGKTQTIDLVGVFEHELMHGFGVVGYRTGPGPVTGLRESRWDHLVAGNDQMYFTGAATSYVYGGNVPVTTGFGAGSDYYHVGAAGNATDPANLRNDLIYPIARAGESIGALDVAILSDIGVPLSAAGYALVYSRPATTFAALAGTGTVSDPLVGGTTQPGQPVTIMSGGAVLGTVIASATGEWSFRPVGLADGTMPLTVALPNNPGAASLTLSLDATAPVRAAYRQVLGREVDAAALPASRQMLLDGTTPTTLRGMLATSVEGSSAIYTIFQDAVGRAVTPGELPRVQQALVDGASLANLRTVLATSGEAGTAVRAMWQAVVGRAATPSEVPAATGFIANGSSIATLRSVLAGSIEASNAVAALFTATVGRAVLATEASGVQAALAGNASLSSLRGVLASSAEAGTAITAMFQSTVGRAPIPAELPAVRQAIAAGASLPSLRGVLATSTEGAASVRGVYQAVLGRAPALDELPAVQANIAAGGSLDLVRAALVGSTGVADAINTAFQSALGRQANAIEVAADRSELASGLSLGAVQAQVAQLAGASPLQPTSSAVPITPQALGSGGPAFVYGLLNNDALVAGQPRTVSASTSAGIQPGDHPGLQPGDRLLPDRDAARGVLLLSRPVRTGWDLDPHHHGRRLDPPSRRDPGRIDTGELPLRLTVRAPARPSNRTAAAPPGNPQG